MVEVVGVVKGCGGGWEFRFVGVRDTLPNGCPEERDWQVSSTAAGLCITSKSAARRALEP